jgi:hypothetical protein
MGRHQRIPQKILRPRAALAKLTQELEKDPGDYEPIAPNPWPPLQVLLPSRRRPARALYLTKSSVLTRWITEGLLPRDLAVLCRPGLPTKEYLGELRERVARAQQTIFIGDLDPLDLHVYVALRPIGEIDYGGINDACLQLCERNLKRGRRLESVMFRMRAAEARHFAIIDSLVDVTAIVGPRSHALLRAGWKLELEGATNLQHFEPRHLTRLTKVMTRARLA